MKEIIQTSLRHMFTGLASLGVFLASKGLINPEDAATANAAGVTLADGLTAIVTILVARLVWYLSSQILPKDRSGSVGLLLVACSLAVGTMLPSCSTEQVEAFRAVPIRIGIEGPDASAYYSSKSGLRVTARVIAEK